jgi:hypothetical protein
VLQIDYRGSKTTVRTVLVRLYIYTVPRRQTCARGRVSELEAHTRLQESNWELSERQSGGRSESRRPRLRAHGRAGRHRPADERGCLVCTAIGRNVARWPALRTLLASGAPPRQTHARAWPLTVLPVSEGVLLWAPSHLQLAATENRIDSRSAGNGAGDARREQQ